MMSKLHCSVRYDFRMPSEEYIHLPFKNSIVLDQTRKTVGFRRVRLVQEPLSEPDRYGKGTTFLFEVNNVRMFIGGA